MVDVRRLIFVVITAVALAVAGCVGARAERAQVRNAPAQRAIIAPDVRGMTLVSADATLIASGLAIGTTATAYDTTAPVTTVIAQNPPAGANATPGASVDVTTSLGPRPPASSSLRLHPVKRTIGPFSPKSVVASQNGFVFAQNMMYRHTISVFSDASHKLVRTIKDGVRLSSFGITGHPGITRGGPVEAAMSPDGAFVYVSNYSMWGAGFSHPGHDVGSPASHFDGSFVYRIPLATMRIDQVISVGSVPKYLAVTPDGRYLLVSNWASYTLSVVDTASGRRIGAVKIGRYPRGIAIDPESRYAYVASMGSSDIVRVDLTTFATHRLRGIGPAPRHVVISPDGAFLYVTLNGSGRIAKVRVSTGKVVRRVSTGRQPRSMAMAQDGLSLYVVNYESGTVSKVRTSDMHVIQTLSVDHHPIGITYVNRTREVWVSCYSGSIIAFADR